MQANTYRVLLQNVKVICEKRENSFLCIIIMYAHVLLLFKMWNSLLLLSCRKYKMMWMKSALNFIVVNKIHLNVSSAVVAWVPSFGSDSSFSLCHHVYLRILERQTYFTCIFHINAYNIVVYCAQVLDPTPLLFILSIL